ncbi:MAG: hypothetical protein AAGA21_09900 [Pseudomonadota bacterium]
MMAAADAAALSEQSISQAIRYLGLIAGRDLSSEDAAWFKEQWIREESKSPGKAAAEVDDLAFAYERHQRDQDLIRLAEARAAIIKTAYCAAEQSSDPGTHRVRDILAPEDLVLTADCILSLVVTRFDVDGLSASHALIASATGQRHDPETDRAEIFTIIKDGFDSATPGEKSLMANGELRYAVLDRFWRRIDGSAEQAAVIQEIGGAATADIKGPARQLESLARSKLGEVDYLAKVGDAKLTASGVGVYEEWLQRIAGYAFSSRDRDWLTQALIEEFKQDTQKALDEIARINVLNRDYRLTESVDAKNRQIATWAASLHCYLSASSDPNDARLLELLFREDPVLDVDCGSNSVLRKSHETLAEADGQRLLEQHVDVGLRFTTVILGRPLLDEEMAVVRKDMIDTFERDPTAWRQEFDQSRALLAKIEKYDTSVFLGMDERKKLFDPIYCTLKASERPYSKDYVAMFEREGDILFHDCEQQLVTTEEEVQAVVAVANFLALLNEMPPLTDAQINEIRDNFKSQYMGGAESSMLALREWWSLLSLEERVGEAERAKANSITIQSDADTIAGYVENAKLQVVLRNAKIQSCRMSAIIVQGQTAIFGAKMGPYTASSGNPLGFSGVELGTLITSSNMLGELCKDVF